MKTTIRKILVFLLIILTALICSCKKNHKIDKTKQPDERVSRGKKDTAQNRYRIRVTQFPPQYFRESGDWTGLDVELVKAVVKETGLEAEFIDIPWSRAIGYLKIGKIDIMLTFSKRDNREEYAYFVGPQRVEQMSLAVHNKYRDVSINSIDDLKRAAVFLNRKIILQQNVAYDPSFDRRLKDDPDFASSFAYVLTSKDSFSIVNSDRGIGFFEEFFSLSYIIKSTMEYENLVIHPFMLSSEPVYFGLSKKISPEKLEKFKTAYHTLEMNGTLEAIRKKWKQMYQY